MKVVATGKRVCMSNIRSLNCGLWTLPSSWPYEHLQFLFSVFSSLKMKPDVVLRHLSIAVAATDQSYMPQQVTVAVGRGPSDLQEVRDVHIPSNVTGYVTLLENANISQLCEFHTRPWPGEGWGLWGGEAIHVLLRFDLFFIMYIKMVIISYLTCF